MTPHIEARKGDYAERVLLPGDPDRAAWIAKTFLDAAAPGERDQGRARFHRQLSWHAGQRADHRHRAAVAFDLCARAVHDLSA